MDRLRILSFSVTDAQFSVLNKLTYNRNVFYSAGCSAIDNRKHGFNLYMLTCTFIFSTFTFEI